MASPESHAIRATLVNDSDTPEVPPAVARQEWEAAVAHVALPATITFMPVDVAGMVGEWVSGPQARSHQVLFYLHGGGYTSGSCATHRELAARLCLASGVRVLLLAYRLAPEHPFPAAVHDAGAGYQWLLDQDIHPQDIVIGGDSSGGGLAIATLLWLREHTLPLPAAGVLLSPWLDLTLAGPSMETHAKIDPLISRKGLQQAADWYMGSADRSHPFASPLFAELSSLPPLFIQVGSDEVLLSDAIRLTEKVRASQGEVTLEVWDGMWHVWQAFAASVPEGQAAIEQIGVFIQQHLSARTRIESEKC